MGQTMGRMPETWEGLLEEKNRVLHWSSEVLARVQDNVTNEDTFLMDYDDNKVDAKIDAWIKTNQTRIDEMYHKYPNAPAQLKDTVKAGIQKVISPVSRPLRNSLSLSLLCARYRDQGPGFFRNS